MIEIEDRDGIRILRMNHGKANAFDVEFAACMTKEISAAHHDDDVDAVVLTGSGKIFSAGVDLLRLLDEGPSYISEFVPIIDRVFAEWAAFPKPMVAAINGHAIAGGGVLACVADYRIAGESAGTIGVPELVVGVPFPPAAFELVRQTVDSQRFRDLVWRGAIVSGEDRVSSGFVDRLVADDQVLEASIEVARELRAIPKSTFIRTKADWRAPVTQAAQNTQRQGAALSAWRSAKTLESIRAYVERTLKK